MRFRDRGQNVILGLSWEGPGRALEATGGDFGRRLGPRGRQRERHFASKRHWERQVFTFFRYYCFYQIWNGISMNLGTGLRMFFSCVFIADGVDFQSKTFQSFPSIYESHSGSEKFRRYAFYAVKPMVSTHSAIFGNVDLPLYFKNIDIDLRKFSAMDFHDFYVVFEVRILMVSWVWFWDDFL